MSGETNLDRLIALMTPELLPETFVFATVREPNAQLLADAVMIFREAEGTTAIVSAEVARNHQVTCTYPCRCITLSVHSSLQAVGFLAVITRALAKAGIGVNPVSAYYHDHLFIADHQAEQALSVLSVLSSARSNENANLIAMGEER